MTRAWRIHVAFTLGLGITLLLIAVAVLSLVWTPTDPLSGTHVNWGRSRPHV